MAVPRAPAYPSGAPLWTKPSCWHNRARLLGKAPGVCVEPVRLGWKPLNLSKCPQEGNRKWWWWCGKTQGTQRSRDICIWLCHCDSVTQTLLVDSAEVMIQKWQMICSSFLPTNLGETLGSLFFEGLLWRYKTCFPPNHPAIMTSIFCARILAYVRLNNEFKISALLNRKY